MEDQPVHIPASFKGLDPNLPIETSRRHLPHWRQEGATYFVTFRQADALPASAIRNLQIETKNFRAMLDAQALGGEQLRKAHDGFQKRFGRLLDHHLDTGAGSCLLKSPASAQTVLDALLHFDHSSGSGEERYELDAVVIMPNHCHLLVRPLPGFDLGSILKSWKSFTAREINGTHDLSGQFWQQDYFDRLVRDSDHYRRIVRYIRKNPQKANLRFGDYLLWERSSG